MMPKMIPTYACYGALQCKIQIVTVQSKLIPQNIVDIYAE